MSLAKYAIKGGKMIGSYSSPVAKARTAYTVGKYVFKGAKKGYQLMKSKPVKKKGKGRLKETGGRNETYTVSNSRYNKKGRGQKLDLALKQALPQIYRSQNEHIRTSAEGTQAFYNAVDLWSYSDLQVVLSPNATPPGAVENEKRMYIQGASIHVDFINLTTTAVVLTIYDWSCKQDLPANPTIESTISAGLRLKYGNPFQESVPYMDPQESSEFRNYFKVEGSKKITLSPGESHSHLYTVQIQRYFVNDKYAVDNGNPRYCKNFSNGVMFRMMGTPCTNNDTSHTTFGAAKIGYINTIKLDYKTPQSTLGPQLTASQATPILNGLGSEIVPNPDQGLFKDVKIGL